MKDIFDHPVIREIMDVLGITKRPDMSKHRYVKRLIRKAHALPVEEWERLSKRTRRWVARNIALIEAGREIEYLPDMIRPKVYRRHRKSLPKADPLSVVLDAIFDYGLKSKDEIVSYAKGRGVNYKSVISSYSMFMKVLKRMKDENVVVVDPYGRLPYDTRSE